MQLFVYFCVAFQYQKVYLFFHCVLYLCIVVVAVCGNWYFSICGYPFQFCISNPSCQPCHVSSTSLFRNKSSVRVPYQFWKSGRYQFWKKIFFIDFLDELDNFKQKKTGIYKFFKTGIYHFFKTQKVVDTSFEKFVDTSYFCLKLPNSSRKSIKTIFTLRCVKIRSVK